MKRQIEKLSALFKERPNQWIPLPDILRLGLAQYNARIYDMRAAGWDIRNRIESVGGSRHSWFMYVPAANQETQLTSANV
jgi:hypothetical protein